MKLRTKFYNAIQGFRDGFVRQDGGSFTVFTSNSLDNLNVNPSTAYWLHEKVSVVSDAVNKVVEPASVLPLAIKDDNSGDLKTDVKSSELLTLLDNPQTDLSGTQLLFELFKSFELTNEAWPVLIGSNRVVSIDFVKPYNINEQMNGFERLPREIRTMGTRYQEKIFVRDVDSNGKTRYLADNGITELVPIINGTNRTDFRALSKLNAAVLDAKQYHLGSTHNAQLLKNGARPTGVVVPKEGLTVEQFKQLESSLKEQFQGAENTGNVIIASVPMDGIDFNINNKDMDYVKLIKMSADRIYTTYNIPLSMISSDKLTFSNVKESTPQLYVQAVIPAFTRFTRLLSYHLQHRFPELQNGTLWYNPFEVPQIQGLLIEKMEAMSKVNVFTDNQILKEAGFDDYDGGDIHYKPSNLVTVDDIRFGTGEGES